MTFKRVNDFSTEDPAKLDRELSQLEDNVDRETREIREQYQLISTVTTFRPLGANVVVAILPNQQLAVDTSLAAVKVVFPALTPKNSGKRFTLIVLSSANAAQLSCAAPTVTLNGSSFGTQSGVKAVTYYCNSLGYFS